MQDIQKVTADRGIGGGLVKQIFGVMGRQGRGRTVQPQEGGCNQQVGAILPCPLHPGHIGRRKGQGELGADAEALLPGDFRQFTGTARAQMQAGYAHDLVEGKLLPVGEQVVDQRRVWLPSRVGHCQVPPLNVS